MFTSGKNRKRSILKSAAILLLPLILAGTVSQRSVETVAVNEPEISSYIVQAASVAEAEILVTRAGGTVTASLEIINAVGADLTREQLAWLREHFQHVRVFEDSSLSVTGPVAETHYPTLVGAAALHSQGIDGDNVTVAVLDTGLWKTSSIRYSAVGNDRVLAQYDATVAQTSRDDDDDDNDDDDSDSSSFGAWWANNSDLNDWNGHGTHITSIIMGSDRTAAGRYQGVAPGANVVAVRAFEPDGSGSYLNVIKALDWIVAQRRNYDIRILNLSFGAPAGSHYWDDPVNQAVMAAWRSGIVVVVAAGNSGPGPMTVGVPGNVPYVITVGAMTDSYTPDDTSDDRLATFSAAGPTVEGFVKPEIIAPGGHMLGKMPWYAWLRLAHPEAVQKIGNDFAMSGTSQAAAVVSGAIALMLQADPGLSPDDVKCRLMASAKPALRDDGTPAYSVFQQGAGLVDATAAVSQFQTGCANIGMNINDDLAGLQHYAGWSGVDQNGTYYLVDEFGERLNGPGYEWTQGSLWPEGALWTEGSIWNQDAMWNQGVLWDLQPSLNNDSLLNQGALWPEGSLWPEGLTRAISTNIWVEAE